MTYKAMIHLCTGGTWQLADTKEEAVKKVVKRATEDWYGLYDIRKAQKAGELFVDIFEDAGTDSHDDDVWLEQIKA